MITFRTISNVLPSELIRSTVYLEFIEAICNNIESPIEQLLDELQLPVSVIISDVSVLCGVGIGIRRNIPVVSVWPMSPSVFSIFYHFDLVIQNGHFPVDLSERGDEILDYIPGVHSMRVKDMPTTHQQIMCRTIEVFSWVKKSQCLIFTSFEELEQNVINSLKATLPFPVYCLGPLIPYTTLDSPRYTEIDSYFNWLDAQPASSVLYVSLGSFLSVSKEQMEEIVHGVHESGVRYLMVARNFTSQQIQEACGGDMGLMVPWCEQLKVLCHSSVGGFLTHSGWNSTLESMFAGVPMLTFPITFDQITNRKLIVDDWKIGMGIKGVPKGDVVGRNQISMILRRFMGLDGDECNKLRRKASDLRDICRESMSKDGSSEANLDAFARNFLKCG